jgi:predicted permease
MVEMDGVMRRIVGVMPRGFAYRDEDVWVPLEIETAHPDAGSLGLIGIARLAPGMDKETAQAEMQDLLVRFSEAHPDELGPAILAQTGLAADVKALKDIYVQDVRDALWILMGTVGFVLLIACANVANLFLVRAEARRREQAVRTAMGAGRADIVRQHLTESVTLAVAGGLLGLGLAAVGVRGLLSLAPADLPGLFEIGIDGSVLVFTGAVSVASGVLFGIFPAFGYGRRDLSDALKDGSRSSSTGKERNRVRKILAVGQVALALVLLVGSGLMLRSFVALRSVDPGFDSAGLATFRLALPGAEYGEPEQVLGFHRELSARLASAPGILGAGMVSGLPLAGSKSAGPMEPLDDPFPEGELGPIVERRSITPGYLETMAIPILDGRGLRWEDQAHQFRGIVISETLARTFWPDGSAVGRQIRNQGSDHPWEVVGVAGDVRFDEVADDPLPLAYFPVLSGIPEELQSARAMDVVVRVAGDPLTAIPTARDVLRSVSGRLPMIRPRTVESVVQDSMASTSFTVLLLGIAAGIALLLGTVGIYGVLSYLVSRRTQEIGVRMAVGAPAGAVRLSVVGEGMALAGMGLAVGLFGAWGLSRVLASLLYGVSTTDLATFGATTLLLALVALAATWVPALRASRVDPVEALKSE